MITNRKDLCNFLNKAPTNNYAKRRDIATVNSVPSIISKNWMERINEPVVVDVHLSNTTRSPKAIT